MKQISFNVPAESSQIVRAWRRLGGWRAALMLAALFVNAILEGLGIAMLVPLIVLALGQQDAMPPLALQILEIIQWLGLPQETWLLATMATILFILREVIGFFIQLWAGYVITDIANGLRLQLLSSISRARWPWFQENRVAGMALTMAQFTTFAAAGLEWAVKSLVLLLRTLTYMALIVVISPWLALTVMLAALVGYGPLVLLVRLTRKYSSKYAGSTEHLGAHFADVFTSIKAIRSMGLERAIAPLLQHFIKRLRRFRRRLLLVEHGLTALQNIMAVIFLFVILYVALKWLHVSVAEVGIIAGLMVSIVKNLSRFQKYMQTTNEFFPYLDKVEDLIESAREARERLPEGRKPALDAGIVFDHVFFSHPGRQVLRDVSFTLPARNISVLVGPSGAGKTTIVDLITGLQEPDGGRILVDDVPLTDIDLKAWRHMIGYVPQELVLFSGTVRDNITLGEQRTDEEIWQALQLAGAADFVHDLPEGLDTDLGERGGKLSGGQRQRLSLARALVRQPKLLILDEVTSALDPDTERQLVKGISDLARREGLTIIAITHNDAWRDVADQVLQLENGHVIVETGGTPASVAE